MEEFTKKYDEILKLFCIEHPIGYSSKEIQEAEKKVGKIPAALRYFYEKYADSEELHGLQDEMILPDYYPALLNDDYIIFFNENQGVCHAGIRKVDAEMIDPPVYTSMDNKEWCLSAEKVSDFLVAMFGYQASICLEYNPEEFYFLEEEEIAQIEEHFPKLPESFKNWLDCEIVLYGEGCEGRIALMIQGEDIQMNYAAHSEEAYEKMNHLLCDIGEEM